MGGLKSKIDAPDGAIDDYKPTLICLEKHTWQKKDKLEHHGIEYTEMMAQKINSKGILIDLGTKIIEHDTK